jgi:hypothetical protein
MALMLVVIVMCGVAVVVITEVVMCLLTHFAKAGENFQD